MSGGLVIVSGDAFMQRYLVAHPVACQQPPFALAAWRSGLWRRLSNRWLGGQQLGFKSHLALFPSSLNDASHKEEPATLASSGSTLLLPPLSPPPATGHPEDVANF